MASMNKFNAFTENVMEAVHNMQSHSFALFFCAAANAPVATNSVLADLTTISYTNGSSRSLTVASSSQSSGTYKWIVTDHVLTISGGAFATFRYTGIYNDTPTSPADPLVCYYDYGSNLTLADGETFTHDFDGTNGVFSFT